MLDFFLIYFLIELDMWRFEIMRRMNFKWSLDIPDYFISLMLKAFIYAIVNAMLTNLNFSVEKKYKKIKEVEHRKPNHCNLSSENVK